MSATSHRRRPGAVTRALLRVMGPADLTPPDDDDRRAQAAYRRLHAGEPAEPQGPSPHVQQRSTTTARALLPSPRSAPRS